MVNNLSLFLIPPNVFLERGIEPGDIIVMDNATFHKGQTITELVEEAGCEIWYLPPYSPDLNKRCDPAPVPGARERAPRRLSVGGLC